MKNDLNQDKMWDLISFVMISEARYATLKSLQFHFLMPADIARNNDMRISKVSKALQGLKNENLVECLTENKRKGRIYAATPLGIKILEIIDNNSP